MLATLMTFIAFVFWLLLSPPPRLHLAPSSLFSCFLLHFVALRCFLNHAYKYATQFFSITTRWQFTFGRGCRPHVPLPVFAFRFAIAIDNLCAERERERERDGKKERVRQPVRCNRKRSFFNLYRC